MIDEENQETRESPAVSADEVSFSREGAEPAPDPSATEPSFSLREDAAATGESPASAQARAESGDESPLERPEVQILGAFVGAFILAKLLQKLFSRD